MHLQLTEKERETLKDKLYADFPGKEFQGEPFGSIDELIAFLTEWREIVGGDACFRVFYCYDMKHVGFFARDSNEHSRSPKSLHTFMT